MTIVHRMLIAHGMLIAHEIPSAVFLRSSGFRSPKLCVSDDLSAWVRFSERLKGFVRHENAPTDVD
jgi:hypothetical protein